MQQCGLHRRDDAIVAAVEDQERRGSELNGHCIFTEDDWELIQDKWGFPLHPLDLSMRNVTEDDLQAQRQAWLGSQR